MESDEANRRTASSFRKPNKSEYLNPTLPEGWSRLIRKRKSGASKDKIDIYLISPEGKKFRSSREVINHFTKNNLSLPQSCSDPKTFFSRQATDVLEFLASHSDTDTEDISKEDKPSHIICGKNSESRHVICGKNSEPSHIIYGENGDCPTYKFDKRVLNCVDLTEPIVQSNYFQGTNVKSECEISYLPQTSNVTGPEKKVKKFDCLPRFEICNFARSSHDFGKKTNGINYISHINNICLSIDPLSSNFELPNNVKVNKWIPPRSPFNLIQETLFHDPWKLLIATIFLSRTEAKRATESFYRFIERWPTADHILEADVAEITKFIMPLGFHRIRAYSMRLFSYEYKYKCWNDPSELFGIGRYGSDSYKIFVTGDWQNCDPQDHMLQKYVHWLAENYAHRKED